MHHYGYPKRRKGKRDPFQNVIYDTYQALIFFVIKNYPGLNVSQIADTIPEVKEDWLTLSGLKSEVKNRLPKGKIARPTVRKHLREMFKDHIVVKIGRRYFASSNHLPEVSAELKKDILRLLSNDVQEVRYISPAADAALCLISSDPAQSHRRFNDLFNMQLIRFTDSLLWLDDILEYAITNRDLSPRVYSSKKNRISIKILKRGWNKLFGNNQLFVFSIAISPSNFLKFLETDIGRDVVNEHLKKSWDGIMDRVNESWGKEKSRRRGSAKKT